MPSVAAGPHVVIFLVHGTFAKNAEWTREEVSDLCKSVRSSLESGGLKVSFVRVPWTGKNRLADRQKGADTLIRLYNDHYRSAPGAVYFAVGHSHGGSVIAYAIQRDPNIKRALRVAFLATPFIDLKIRESLGATVAVPITLAAYAVFIWTLATHWSLLAAILRQLFARLDFQLGEGAAHVIALICMVAALCIVGLAIHRAVCLWARVACDNYSKTYATTNFEPDSHVFVRCVGDEASATLAAGQFANWAIGKITDWFIFVARKLDAIVWFWRRLVSGQPILFCLALVAGAVLSIAALVVTVFYAKDEVIFVAERLGLVSEMMLRIGQTIEAIGASSSGTEVAAGKPSASVALTKLLMFGVALEFVFIFAISFVVYGLGLAVMAIATIPLVLVSALYGRAAIWRNFFLDIAVEPTPIGDVTLKQLDWDEVHGARLNHSDAYDNPKVHRFLSEWISSGAQSAAMLADQNTIGT